MEALMIKTQQIIPNNKNTFKMHYKLNTLKNARNILKRLDFWNNVKINSHNAIFCI